MKTPIQTPRLMTPEERELDRLETEAEVARLKALGGDDLPQLGAVPKWIQPERVTRSELEGLMARVSAKVEDRNRERLALPCYQAMYPDGVVPAEPEATDDVVGKRACEAREAWKTCEHDGYHVCARARASETLQRVARNLDLARVPSEESEVLLQALRDPRNALKPYDPMRVARARLKRERVSVPLEDGDEMLPSRTVREGRVDLIGNERVLVFAGNAGRGKTTAAQYILAREGGLYTREYGYGRRRNEGGVDLQEAMGARVLVIDQVSRGVVGNFGEMVAALEEVVDHRVASGRLTVIVGNLSFEQFQERYGTILVDRVFGFGVFVLFAGESLRTSLRDGAKK